MMGGCLFHLPCQRKIKEACRDRNATIISAYQKHGAIGCGGLRAQPGQTIALALYMHHVQGMDNIYVIDKTIYYYLSLPLRLFLY